MPYRYISGQKTNKVCAPVVGWQSIRSTKGNIRMARLDGGYVVVCGATLLDYNKKGGPIYDTATGDARNGQRS